MLVADFVVISYELSGMLLGNTVTGSGLSQPPQ